MTEYSVNKGMLKLSFYWQENSNKLTFKRRVLTVKPVTVYILIFPSE